jgi:gliding motility-associated-like protein
MRNQSTGFVKSIFLVCWGLVFFTHIHAQVFVSLNATGANDGSSWVNAYTDLQTALTNTSEGEMWVARGTYRPLNCTPCNLADKEISFQIPPDVQVYGGFIGTESNRSQRNWEANPTILSGDTGVQGDSTDNVYRVVIAENSTPNTILDGFIIEEGNADGSFGFSAGGGLYMDANPGGTADMQVRNCIFRNNYAGGGGGLAIDCVLGGSSRALIYNCTFEGNTASLRVVSSGAAVFIQGNAGATIQPKFIQCTFRNNFCGNDGGAFSATPTGAGSLLAFEIDSCRFENNRASDRGAAVWYRMSSQGQSGVSIKNSQFIQNTAGGQGGAIYARSSFGNVAQDTILNCFFSQNVADGSSAFNDGEGGAIFLRGSQTGIRNQHIINCAFDRNFAEDRAGAIGMTSFITSGGECNLVSINCTFSRNKTNGEGGAMHVESERGMSDVLLLNNIFWEDSSATGNNEILNNGGNIGAVFCNFQGGLPTDVTDGGSNTSLSPQFADPSKGDLRLLRTSPLVDVGENLVIESLAETDLDGNKRIHNGMVDLGAYEIGIIYVDLTAINGLQNGTSWENAFLTVPEALEVARSGDQVWVADGAYFPTSCDPCTESDKEIAMQLVPNAEMYGGFQGNEDQLDQRDWAAFPSILSGDIGIAGDSTDNSYKVLIAENSTTYTLLDGFIIEEGNADGSFGFSSGGGLYIDANPGGTADMQVRNCTFRNNYGGGGGGLAIDCVLGGSSQALIYNCTFEGNTASLRVVSTGAAVFMQGNSGAVLQPRFVKCTFQNNYCGNDGGAFSATPTGEGSLLAFEIDSCLFVNNRADDRGGALWYRMSSGGQSRVVIKNTDFVSNHAGGQGGAVFARSSFDNVANDTIINCMFRENISDGSNTINDGAGGAIFIRSSQNGSRTHQIINAVFYKNFAAQSGGAVGTTSFVSAPGNNFVDIVNSTFFQNTTNGNGGALHADGSQGVHQVNIRNSILWDNQSEVDQNEVFNIGANISIDYSNIKNAIPNNITDGGNNLSEDPQFVDPENGDLRISACSPMIEAGNNDHIPNDFIDLDEDSIQTEPIELDILGEKRVFNEIVDMGAYEWNGTPPALSISIDSSQVNCNGLCEASAVIEVQGGVPDYEFSWSDGQNTATAQNLCAGNYYVTVSDGANCLLIDSVTIGEFPPLEASISPDTSICENTSVLLSATASGGAGGYTYAWDNNLGVGTSQNVTPTASTTYTVQVMDSNNCMVEKSVSIDVNPNPVIDLQESYRFCSGQSVDIDAGFFAAYEWSTGDTTRQINVEQPGNYTLKVRDENGCSSETTFEMLESPNPEVSISGDPFTCEGKTTVLEAGLFEKYAWSTGDSTAQIVVDTGGSYEVSVVDVNGCTGSATITVSPLDPPDPTITGNTSFCLGGQAQLQVVEDFLSYQWSNGITGQELITNQIGSYTVEVTDESGCVGRTTVEINDNAQPPEISWDTSNLIVNCDQNCIDLAVEVSGSVDYAVDWSSESGLFAAAPGALTVQVCRGDTYFVEVRDKVSACVQEEAIVVREDKTAPVIDPIDGLPAFDCQTETISLTAVVRGELTQFQWSTENGGNISPATGELNVEVDAPGDYQLDVRAGNGCTASQKFTVPSNIRYPLAMAGNDQILLCGETLILDGSISDQGPDFRASWQSEDGLEISRPNSLTPEISEPGSYILTVENLTNGCEASDTVAVSLQFPESADAGVDFSVCEATTNLSANLPEGTQGTWTSNSSAVILDATSPQTGLTGLIPGEQSFTWTLSAPGCPDYSSDEVRVTISEKPVANNDILNMASGENRNQTIDLAANDRVPSSGLWDIELLGEPEIGRINAITGGQFVYSVAEGAFGESRVTYRLCSLECPDDCSEATLFIRVEQEKITSTDVPNAITPNEDGVNDRFVFDILDVNPPDRFPDNELIVFNRWGDIVFQQQNYDNSWGGVNQSGEPLPSGTYYYILRLDLEDGYILRGDISIIR